MSSFIDYYDFSRQLCGTLPPEYEIIYFIVTLFLIVGTLLVIFSPFIFLGKLLFNK